MAVNVLRFFNIILPSLFRSFRWSYSFAKLEERKNLYLIKYLRIRKPFKFYIDIS